MIISSKLIKFNIAFLSDHINVQKRFSAILDTDYSLKIDQNFKFPSILAVFGQFGDPKVPKMGQKFFNWTQMNAIDLF